MRINEIAERFEIAEETIWAFPERKTGLSRTNVPVCIGNARSVYYQVLPKENKNIQNKKVHYKL